MNIYKTLLELKYDVKSIFKYGSVVYGTNTHKSDNDFIVIVNSNTDEEHLTIGNNDFNIYSTGYFINLLNEHDISALECIYLNSNNIVYNELDFSSFKVDKVLLRKSISSKANNSWAKFKKKFTIEKDYNIYVAKKSLFHVLRIYDFGIQIAEKGFIYDYKRLNHYYFSIINNYDGYLELKNKFQPIRNKLASEFKVKAPK